MVLSTVEPEIRIVKKEIFCNNEVLQDLKNIDINNLTPIDALNKISELKSKI